jgi:hypothetical protein
MYSPKWKQLMEKHFSRIIHLLIIFVNGIGLYCKYSIGFLIIRRVINPKNAYLLSKQKNTC